MLGHIPLAGAGFSDPGAKPLSSTVYPVAIGDGAFGAATVANLLQYLLPAGVASAEAFGTPLLQWTQFLTPPGVAAGAVGTASIVNRNTYLYPAGVAAGGFGTPTTYLYTRYLLADPAVAGEAFGTAAIINRNRYVAPGAIASVAAYGTPFVAYGRRTLAPASIVATAFGVAQLAGGIRWLDQAGQGSHSEAFGTAAVTFRVRFVYPQWISSFTPGTAEVHNNTQFVAPTGWQDSAIGTQYAHDSRQWAIPAGLDATSWGVATLHNTRKLVGPIGFPTTVDTFPSTRWGRPDVYNLTQILQQLYLTNPDQDEAFGSPFHMTVENRNRTMLTYGHVDSRFGNATMHLSGVALEVSGFDATGWGAATFIAYRIRTVTPTDPIGPEIITRYNAVIPTPQLFPPSIAGRGTYGTATVVNTRRYYNVPLFETIAWGRPFVAPRVRTVSQYWPWEGIVGAPDVQLATRYVRPTGFERSEYGVPMAFTHRNEVTPRWVWPHDLMGTAIVVRNVTPQLYQNGRDQTEWGTPEIRWNPFPLRPAGLDATRWGGNVIEHREKTVRVSGLDVLRFGVTTQIRNDLPDPPGQQTLLPSGAQAPGFGAQLVELFNRPIYPAGIFSALGNPTVTLIGAICTGFRAEAFGTPWVRGPQYMTAAGIGAPDEAGWGVTKHRMSPFTIYASNTVPAGYTTEGGGEWREVDVDTSTWPAWGTAEVTNWIRTVTAAGFDRAAVGAGATVELKTRRLLVNAIAPRRVGFPTIPGPQEATIVPWTDVPTVPAPSVELKNRQLVLPGIAATLFGVHRVEMLNRELLATGWSSFAPGVDRIHYPEPIIPGMGVQTLWGTAFIADRIRTIEASGFDAFADGFEPGKFDQRSRVRHRYGAGRLLFPAGVSHGTFGSAGVAHA